MSKLTKQHFQDAASDIAMGKHQWWKTEKERRMLVAFCLQFFRRWNGQFDAERFIQACEPKEVSNSTIPSM